METIKQGFEVKFVVFYQNQAELVNLVKILQRILPRTLQIQFEIEFYKISGLGNNLASKNFLVTEILPRIATREKISYVGLPISPLVFPSAFIKKIKLKIFEFGLIPFVPLSGIGLEIFENAKEIGFEKHVEKIEKILRTKIIEKRIKKLSERDIDGVVKSKKTARVNLGPNVLHEILDTLQIKH